MVQRLILFSVFTLLVVGVKAITVQISVNSPAYCVNPTGSLSALANGGVGPYSYLWSTGATNSSIYGLVAGSYSVTVTDFNNDQATAQITLTSESYPPLYPVWLPGCPADSWPGGAPYRLVAEAYPSNSGFPPYSYSDPNAVTLEAQGYHMHYFGFLPNDPPGSPISITITDANGCTSMVNTTVPPVPQPLQPQVLEVNGSCSGGSNGSLRIYVPAEPNYWSSSFTLNGPSGQISWSNNANEAGYADIEFIATDLQAGTYYLVNTTSWNGLVPQVWQQTHFPWIGSECPDTTVVVVPDLGFTCGTVSGKLFVDSNGNCTPNSNSTEPGLPNTVMEFQPGDHFTLTDNFGQYSINLPYGTYTITEHNDLVTATCNAETTPITVASGTPFITHHVPTVGLQGLDMQITMGSGPARPGFSLNYGITVHNLTATASGSGTVTMNFDPQLQFISANPPPSSVTTNTITWSNGNMWAFQQRNFTVTLQVPPDVGLLGMELEATATVTTTATDVEPENNTVSHSVTVTGSYDPNDKLVETSTGLSGSEYFIDEDDWLNYTIRFQNTGTDTAFFVVITDTLSAILDPATFQSGAASHSYSMTMQDRVLRFMFPNILLPDSNVNEPRSHGFVSFRIKPVDDLQPGDQITNIANIYFDYNPPVITDPSVLVASVPPIKVAVKAMLGGPFVSGTNTMNDGLRSSGSLPLAEPYIGLGYDHAGSGGGESTTAGVFAVTGNTAIVDWVVIELRDPSTFQVMHSRSALIRRDGQVVDVDGVSPVSFNAFEGNYRVAIKHRNHLGCMTSAPVALSSTSTIVDLTVVTTATYGTGAQQNISGTMALWSGDVNFDGVVKYTGLGNDRDPVLVAIGGTVPTNVVSGDYTGEDVDMNGSTKYTGTTNDRDIILQTIGGVVPTAVRLEQLP